VIKIKCSISEFDSIRVNIDAKDKDYTLLSSFLSGFYNVQAVVDILKSVLGIIAGTYFKEQDYTYDYGTEGVGLHLFKDTVALEYCIVGTINKETITLPIQDFLEATETYARFLNKYLKARHAKLNWGKEEVAENDKQLKTYFKNKNNRNKIKCSMSDTGSIQIQTPTDKEYGLLRNFLTDCHSVQSIVRVLHQIDAAIAGTYKKDEANWYDYAAQGVAYHIIGDTVQFEYCLTGMVKDQLTMPITDFLEAAKTYARFINKTLKANPERSNKEEIAEGDKQLKTYFKNEQS
jgi:hypothetical protein